MNRLDEFRALAKANGRAKFAELCRYPFLVGMPQLSRPNQPGRTMMISPLDREGLLSPRPRRTTGESGLLVLPVRKIQDSFPSMITVGRTNNNDLVIEDVQVSKFHAFFRITDERVELADAGSRNGTFLGKVRLETKGSPQPVRLGEPIRFGQLEFIMIDAASCWDRIHV